MIDFIENDSETAAKFIESSANLAKIMQDLIIHGDSALIFGLLEKGDFFTKRNIDKYIDMAIKAEQTDIYMMLTNYKAEHIGFEDTFKCFKL